jgi:magnesium chelatase family protein
MRYLRRVSGPLLDRIDLRVVMPRVDAELLVDAGSRPEGSREVAARIERAWNLAHARNNGRPNALLRGSDLIELCALDRATRATLQEVSQALELTARSVHRVMRVARTIADLRGVERVGADEILAATSLRDRSMETDLAA